MLFVVYCIDSFLCAKYDQCISTEYMMARKCVISARFAYYYCDIDTLYFVIRLYMLILVVKLVFTFFINNNRWCVIQLSL